MRGWIDECELARRLIIRRAALSAFYRDQQGASGAEYALILVMVGCCVAMAAMSLGAAFSTALRNTAAQFISGA